MSEKLTLTAIYEQVEDGWVQVRLLELPEVITVAPDRDQARDLLLDALREYLLSLAQDTHVPAVSDRAYKEQVEFQIAA
jgi:hypothetical protein